jgi:xanthine dehydrogenase YagS FAD-binding subunit
MNLFEYIRAASVEEAIGAWRDGAAYLGGGTNLVDLMKTGATQPERLIDLNRLPGLNRIEILPDGSTRIGALVRNADLAHDPDFAATFPMVAEALLSGASGQLRNAATVGGNLLQRTRCAYFQDPHSACNRREEGRGCDARGGENSNLAVLGWSEACIATNPSDLCVALAALDAVIEVQGRNGAHDIAFADFHLLPGATPSRETALKPDEIVLAVRLPAAAAALKRNARYLKVRDRTSFAFALVSAAAALRLEDGKIADARLALGSVAARPWRVAAVEALMIGQEPSPDLFARAAAAALEGARPSGANAHKVELARRTAARALALAAKGTPARMPALPASPVGDYAHV